MTPPHGALTASRPQSAGRARPPDDPPVGRGRGGPPRRAGGLELLGAMAGSGYRQAPSLVRRADGQTLQLTPILYKVLQAVDGHRDPAAIAARLAERHAVEIDPDDIEFLLDTKLRPLGVLAAADGSEPAALRANPLLALRGRKVMADPSTTIRMADRFTFLFTAPVMIAVVLGFVASSWWLFVNEGLGDATRHVIYQPELLLLAFALTLVSAGFHELGHAAACRYGGATPGAMGAALYLVWPAFYTDVTDSYQLSRRGRLRVDLGGIYFNAVFSVAAFAVWAATHWDALLVVMFLQLVQMLRQLVPIVRFDGYHILADLTGVPDLFSRIKPTLLGALPWRWGRPESKMLKPWARVVVTAWVVAVVPILLMSLLLMVVALPRLAATAWDSVGQQWAMLVMRWAEADLARVALGLISIVAITVPVASVSYLLFRIGRRTARRVWRASDDDGALRLATIAAGAALLVAATAAWWPNGQYRPIEAGERLTVPDVAGQVVSLDDGSPARMASASWPEWSADGAARPVLHRRAAASAPAGPITTVAPSPPERARFTPPSPPGEGDNQALALNYTDGSTLVATALSLIWATGDDDVTSVNQAYALASCRQCTTLAVAFQLILVVGDVDVVAPRNEAVAVNARCDQCVTRALAVQLLLTVAEPPDQAALDRLDEIWGRLEALGDDVESLTLEETYEALAGIEADLVALFPPADVIGAEPDPTTPTTIAPGTGGLGGSDEAGEAGTTSTTAPDATTTSAPSTTTTTPSETTATDPSDPTPSTTTTTSAGATTTTAPPPTPPAAG